VLTVYTVHPWTQAAMPRPKVSLLDYGAGNVCSVRYVSLRPLESALLRRAGITPPWYLLCTQECDPGPGL
jgi:hypothetical protein